MALLMTRAVSWRLLSSVTSSVGVPMTSSSSSALLARFAKSKRCLGLTEKRKIKWEPGQKLGSLPSWVQNTVGRHALVIPGFLTPVLTQLSFQSHRLLLELT